MCRDTKCSLIKDFFSLFFLKKKKFPECFVSEIAERRIAFINVAEKYFFSIMDNAPGLCET